MKTPTRYIFGAAVAAVALSGVPATLHLDAARGATVGLFTFEGLTVTGAGSATSGTGFGPYSADSGVGTAFGVHAASTTVYSPPSGNGSLHSLSANGWASGDYFEFDVPTTGVSNIVASFDEFRSGTGPAAFQLQYSVNGTNFSSFSNYVVANSVLNSTGGTATAWGTSVSVAGYNFLFDLSAITDLNNDANAKFRLVESDTTTAPAGTNRVDNFMVTSSAGGAPEPASVSLMTAAAAAALLRRRRNA